MGVHLEQLYSAGGCLDPLKLLNDLVLDLLPLGLAAGVDDAGQQPVYLLHDTLVIDAGGVVVARQCHLPGELGVLADLIDGHGHVAACRPSSKVRTLTSLGPKSGGTYTCRRGCTREHEKSSLFTALQHGCKVNFRK